MPSFSSLSTVLLLVALARLQQVVSFHMPHAGHQHPLYVRYRQDLLEKSKKGGGGGEPHSQAPSPSDIMATHGTAMAISEEEYQATRPQQPPSTTTTYFSSNTRSSVHLEECEVTICTPVSYDEETGMVQTAVRAIVQHPISGLMDNHMVGLSSTLVVTTGALHEVLHCLELEWTHQAISGTTEELAILSLGHFLHYGREAIRQLGEMHHKEEKETE